MNDRRLEMVKGGQYGKRGGSRRFDAPHDRIWREGVVGIAAAKGRLFTRRFQKISAALAAPSRDIDQIIVDARDNDVSEEVVTLNLVPALLAHISQRYTERRLEPSDPKPSAPGAQRRAA